MESCPLEVWQLILGNLSSLDVARVALVNRTAHGIAQALLFSNIELKWKPSGPPSHIITLIRLLLQRPDLASRNKRLVLTGSSFDIQDSAKTLPVPDDGFQDLAEVVISLQSTFTVDWVARLRFGKVDAFVTLLLAQLPNIAHLKLTYQFARGTALMAKLFCWRYTHSSLKNGPVLFSQLTRVELQPFPQHHSPWEGGDMDQAFSVFYLPALQHFEAEIFTPYRPAWPLRTPPKPRSLQSLKLIVGSNSVVNHVLAKATRLDSLDWQFPFNDKQHVTTGVQYLELQVIGVTLQPVANTLTSLALSKYDYGKPTSYVFGRIARNIIFGELNLRSFVCLRELDVGFPFLIGLSQDSYRTPLQERLPATLEHLGVIDDHGNTNCVKWNSHEEFDILKAWWADLKAYTPLFVSFKLRLKWTRSKWLRQERIALWELGRIHGIKVVVNKALEDTPSAE